MRVFIHVVGESTTGLDSSEYKEIGFHDARERAVSAWQDQALALLEDPAALAEFLRQPRKLDPDGTLVVCASGRPMPLVSLLGEVDPADEVELLLVGTDNDLGVPSLRLAETLRQLLDRHSRLLGPEVIVRVEAPKFDLDDVADVVREAMRVDDPADSPPVEILWGPGSTELSLGIMSGVITTGRPWLLRRADDDFDEVRVLPDHTYPPLVSWLLRYGYPGRVRDALDESGVTAPDLLRIADAAAAPLRAVAAGTADPATLATWVHTDVRRRNRTAGLAVRAWMTAEYRRRCTAEGQPDATQILGRINIVELGGVIDAIQRPPAQLAADARRALTSVAASDSGRWLVGRADLNKRASKSAHEFKALNPSSLRLLRAEIGAQGAVQATTDCGPFHFPTGVVAYLWTEGRTRPGGRGPVITTVLGTPPPPELLGLVPPTHVEGYSPHTYVDLLILASAQAMPYASEQVQRATDNVELRQSPYQFVLPVTQPRQVEFKDAAGRVLRDAEANARKAADTWLRERDVDAIVVVPSGPKEQVTGLLTAALDYGHRRAVPVFVQALTSNPSDDRTRFHRFLPYLSTNAPVLELARNSMRDLAFDTAVALVGLCRAPDARSIDELNTVTVALRELRDAFFADAGTAARDRMMLCAKLANGAEVVDQIRLVHVAAELFRRYGPKPATGAGRQLGWLRNRLGVNHGGRNFDNAMRTAASKLGIRHLTSASLILAAAQQMSLSPAAESMPIKRYDMIVATLQRLIEQAKAAQNRPVVLDGQPT